MKDIEYYRKRYYAYYRYVADTQREESRELIMGQYKRIEKAFKEKNERFLKSMDKELTIEINEYPRDYREEINRYITEELGYDPRPEQEREKLLKKILKRGSIKNRDEYELVHSRIDELAPEAQTDKKAMKEFEILDKMLFEYTDEE